MDQFVFKTCQSTQSPEKFLCLNEECYKQDKKQIQCYQCMTKYHLGKNKVVKHVDDFIEFDKFMTEIKKKLERRNLLVMSLTQQVIDFQKQKLQEIQSSKNLELITMASQKIEIEVNTFVKQIHESYLNLKFSNQYSATHHLTYIKFYFEDEIKTNEEAKLKLKIFVQNLEKYVQTLDLDLRTTLKRSKEKFEKLEKQVNQFSKCFIYNKLQTYLLILLIPYLLYLQFNQFEIVKWQQRSENYHFLCEQLAQQIELFQNQISLNQMQIEMITLNQTQTYQLLNSSIQVVSDGLQKLKLRFDTFKQSSTSNIEKVTNSFFESISQLEQTVNQLKQASKEIQNQIPKTIEKIQNLEKSTQKLFEDQQKLFMEIMQNFNQNKFKSHKNTLKAIKFLNEKKTTLKLQQLKSYLKLLIEYRHLIKIHVDYPVEELSKFQLLYNELFTQFFSSQKMMEIQSIVFKNDGDNPLICVGGLEIVNPKILKVVACDFATEVFQATFESRRARKSSYGNIFWYQVEFYSFGFAPNQRIKLMYCDDFDEQDVRRLSYWYNLPIPSGGRRLGNEILLENSTQHRLQIYMLRFDQ